LMASVANGGRVQTTQISVAATEGFAHRLIPWTMARIRPRSHSSCR
jgi:hypothetical protein